MCELLGKKLSQCELLGEKWLMFELGGKEEVNV